MNIYIIIWLLFVHWVADFVCQSEKWATTKKSNNHSLIKHTLTYSYLFVAATIAFLPIKTLILFGFILFVSHTLIDYFTSKLVGKKFENKQLGSEIPNLGAFSIIGLDQFIHFVVLVISFYYLYQ